MTEHRTERLATLFDRCLAAQRAGAPIDREQLLAEHPDLADDLRAGLDSLGVLGEVATLAGEPHEPRVLGDFRIVREIGRGGMGVVYEAEQLSLGRRVALKVLPFAAVLDQKQLQRFRNEAQAAAHLHHTSIVPVHAVGCERGVHYYAMQYIEGESLARAITELRREGGGHGGTPISSHASNREPAFLRMAARIGEQAAEALDHAHQMGVVHRDVKPGNLLVDAAGSLWVADFGLARFERAEAVTVTGDLVGTFRYMSPEQALGKRVPIDHRTDVYSLGATLYELVTLEPAVTGTDPQAVIQEIAFKDPRLPRRLNPAVPPDLETILMKAMAKDPAGRYATAQEMADDLRSFLADLPIRARRPTLSDRALKWARRHRTVVGAAVALLLLATAGMAVASVLIAKERDTAEERRKEAEGEREEARRQAALAEAVAAFLNDDLLGTIAQERTGLGATLREFLDAASERIGDRFASEPLVEARIRRTIAEAYEKLGLNEVAEPHLLRACELLAGVLGEAHPDTLRAQYALASSLDDQSRHKEAEALIRSVFERQREVLGDLHKHTLRSKYKLANTLRSLGRAREAEALLREVLETQRRLLGDDAHDTISSINSLASALEAQGRAAEAEPLIREAIEIQGRKGGKSARILGYMNNLANDLRAQGRHAEAEALHREVLEARRRVLDEEHPDTLETRRCLADDLAGQGRLAEAEAIYRDTLVSYERVRGEDHFQTLAAKSGLAAVLSGQGKHAEAEALARRVLDRGRLLRGDEAPETLDSMVDLAVVLRAASKGGESEALLRAALEIGERALGEERPQTLAAMESLAGGLSAEGRHAEAEAHFRRALELRRRVDGDESDHTARTAAGLARSLSAEGKLEEAGALVDRLVASGRHPQVVSRLCEELARLHATTRDPKLRDPVRAVKLAEAAVALAPDDPASWATLGVASYRAGDWSASVAAISKSLELRADAHGRLYLAMARWQIGEKDGARRDLAEASATIMDGDGPRDEELRQVVEEATTLLGGE